MKYSVCDLTKGIWEDELIVEASSPMSAVKRYLKPTSGQRIKRSDYGNIVVTGPGYRKYVYQLTRIA